MAMPATQCDSRRQFHAVFNNWLNAATEADFDALTRAREAYAPGRVCSMFSLLMESLSDPTAVHLLPESLVNALKVLQPDGWPLHVVGAQSA